ncbi:MAG: hypothetical protein KBC96_05945 [Armatimonadetes bacterium]|nr:hypothetical protein [Armatimonadota bacterium]
MPDRRITLIVLSLVILSSVAAGKPIPKDEYLVGVYYFAGWWRDLPNKWNVGGRDWRADFPARVPTLGEYNTQLTMNREIIAASSHGVDFFQILWYPQSGEPHKLNEGLRTFMASPNARRMAFTIEFVNHPPFALDTDAKWEAACREWAAAMKHPSYLRVGGRPVFKIHGAHFFLQQNGNDPARVTARLDALRRIARESGVPAPLIGGGVMSGLTTGQVVSPYDFLTTYMDMPNVPQKPEPYPYEDLIEPAQDAWKAYGEKSEKPYVPYVPSGWDPRPWKDPRPSFDLPNRLQWTAALKSVKSALDTYPKLGFPIEGGRQKALLIYAWNEFGEGGIVAPTKGDGTMKLEVVKAVFGSR